MFVMGTLGASQAQQPVAVDFDGTKWVLGNAARNETGAITEFAPEGEELAAWSKLMTFQHFPNRASNAQETARELFQSLKAGGRGSFHDLIIVEGTPEAYFAYIAADAPDDPAPEFTIFKFGPDAGGTGVVALQISEKLGADEQTQQAFAEHQKYWMQRLFSMNLDFVRNWFAEVLPAQ
jgi:hypothetical protein